MTTNLDEKNTPWALKTFRPLLKALKLQEVKSEPFTVLTSKFKIFHRYNMSNCIIVVRTKVFTNKDDRGIFIWQYDEETRFYALYIVLNESLYETNDIEMRIKRKTTGVHEFTHCVAAMMTFSRLQSKILVRTMHERMKKQFHSLDKNALELLLKEYARPFEKSSKDAVVIFPDPHFRTGSEDFVGDYDVLVRNFLLSYDLFCEQEYFNTDKQTQFRTFLKNKQSDKALELILSVIEPLSKEKALSIPFIVQRINEEFIKRLKTQK